MITPNATHLLHWRRQRRRRNSIHLLLPHSVFLLLILHFTFTVHSLDQDGALLLAFKYSITTDPSSALSTWTYNDNTPCAWHGITCGTNPNDATSFSRVTGISLPSSQLTGYLSPYLGYLDQLQSLNLSSNSLNGSIPPDFFRSSSLRILDLSDNLLSGDLPGELLAGLQNLEILNLSDNAFSGDLPRNLSALSNLTEISLRSNYFSGQLWSGVNQIRILDLSSNLVNGTLPPDFGGRRLSKLNTSFNRISGEIPVDFANDIPEDATIDLSYNQLSGEIPKLNVLVNQSPGSFTGNSDSLCGKPLSNLCYDPFAPAVSPVLSPPAIAAKPRIFDYQPTADSPAGLTGNDDESHSRRKPRLKPRTIAIIIAADLAGIMIIALVLIFVYRVKRKRSADFDKSIPPPPHTKRQDQIINSSTSQIINTAWSSPASSSTSSATKSGLAKCFCLRRNRDVEDSTEYSETSSEVHDSENTALNYTHGLRSEQQRQQQKQGKLVTVDGGVELELETLLKASAYILGASGPNIMYRAVLEDGSALAVRRIGDGGRAAEFEGHVRMVAKVAVNHSNLVRIRGFYLGEEEKLIIYEFVGNGSLATAIHRKSGSTSTSNSSPSHLPWYTRLNIAKGLARGLCYLHDKKHVHGNIKPSNILLGPDTEPKIADFGLDHFITTATSDGSSHRVAGGGGSTRHFGSRRSMTSSRESFPEVNFGPGAASPSPSYVGWFSPYHPPESLRTLKPNSKWDVYSFGVVLIELLTGKVLGPDDVGPWMAELPLPQALPQEKARVLKMADVALRAELEGNEDALLACLKLGSSCVAAQPQKRPTMKEALQVLDRVPVSSRT